MLKILFLGKDKPGVRQALSYLHKQPGFKVVGVVTTDTGLADFTKKLGLPALSHDEAHGKSWKTIDLAVSYLYPRLIREPLISQPRLGCINFHPAPLPKYRGVAPYSRAILEDEKTYGVSAHYVDKGFDSGDLIEVKSFKIDHDKVTALVLEQQAAKQLYLLFVKVLGQFAAGEPPTRNSQKGADFIYTKHQDLDVLREVKIGDSTEVIARKIRAFFYPPHGGAFIKIGGQEFTLLDNARWAEINSRLDKKQ